MKVRPHHSGVPQPSLAASSPEDQVQARHDTNACMDWRQFTWSMIVMQFLLSPASDISGLLTPGHCPCQGRQQHWG